MTARVWIVNTREVDRQQLLAEGVRLAGGSSQGEEVGGMLSSRVKLALLAVASVVGAALVGGLPWGP
jgi:hypothetical protein